MAKIISVCNQKGGVGKTTTAINLGASLAAAEKRTLIVDFDSQANTTGGLGMAKGEDHRDSYRLVLGEVSAEDAAHDTNIKYLKIIPATIDLVASEVELIDAPHREGRLKEALAPVADQYDYILIDCPPSLGFLTLNALVASDSVLIPVQCEYYALEGLSDLMGTIERVREGLNPHLEIEGILLTMADVRTSLSRQVETEIRENFPQKVYRVQIPRNVRLAEAPSHGKPVLTYDFRSKGAQSYLELAEEFLASQAAAQEVRHGAA